MKKYKLLKDITGAKAGTEFELDNGVIFTDLSKLLEPQGNIQLLIDLLGIENKEYFEEMVAEDVPEFKIGDCAVYDGDIHNSYIKIYEISVEDGKVLYNQCAEQKFRKPTQEELEKYFR